MAAALQFWAVEGVGGLLEASLRLLLLQILLVWPLQLSKILLLLLSTLLVLSSRNRY